MDDGQWTIDNSYDAYTPKPWTIDHDLWTLIASPSPLLPSVIYLLPD
jgi:hypothetical protein